MWQLKNRSPLKAAFARYPDAHGTDTMYLVVSATFQLWPALELSESQLKPNLSDDYFEAPGTSSLRYPGELHLGKPGTDLILIGHACASGERPVTELDVRLKLADREKTVRILGDRHWDGHKPSPPAPFMRMPLRYEKAFGGVVRSEDAPSIAEEKNPLGVGLGLASGRAERGDLLPNLEDPKQLLAEGVHPTPAGFGAIPPAWLARRSFAGTYDDAWKAKRAPYLPKDFDSRFFNAAAEGLAFDRHLQGGEPLTLEGASRLGPLETALPHCAIETAFVLRGERHVRPNRLQTVLLEPDDNRMCLTFHADFPCDKVALEVEAVHVELKSLQLPASGHV